MLRRSIVMLMSLLAVILLTGFAVRGCRAWDSRNEALREFHAQVVDLGYGDKFLEALDPSLVAALGLETVTPVDEHLESDAMIAFEALCARCMHPSSSAPLQTALNLAYERPSAEWGEAEWALATKTVEDAASLVDDITALAEMEGPLQRPDMPLRMDTDNSALDLVRSMSALVFLDALVAAHDGDVPGALASMKTLVLLARSTGESGQLMARLRAFSVAGTALDALDDIAQPGVLSAEQTKDIIGFLDANAPDTSMTLPLILDTAEWLNAFQDMLPSAGGINALFGGGALSRAFYEDEATHMRTTAMVLPATVSRETMLDVVRTGRTLPPATGLTAGAVLGMGPDDKLRMVVSGCACAMKIQLARVGLALEAYVAHEGKAPPNLDAVAGMLSGEVPVDPLSGAPFVYRPVGEDFTLYSVGRNLVDDGGVHHELFGDWVWRGVETKIKPTPTVRDLQRLGLPGLPGLPGPPSIPQAR